MHLDEFFSLASMSQNAPRGDIVKAALQSLFSSKKLFSKIMKSAPRLFQGLRNPLFARLYAAQTVNLIGDALTWVGLALLAFELAGQNSGIVLSSALTLRVTAFVLLSPLAGSIADRVDRKRIMVITHLTRMLIVACLPFVNQIWQIYAIVLGLNIFNAFFTPTYKATIPLVTEGDEYPQAIALSSTTYQLLSVIGPGIAGAVAAFVGARQVFFLDAVTFLIAAVLIVTLPGQIRVVQTQTAARTVQRTLRDIRLGTTVLFVDPPIRYALLMQLVASVAGAQILVNTVGHVSGVMGLGKAEYGWVMSAFGVGAVVASVSLGNAGRRWQRLTFAGIGAALITLALLPANQVGLVGLLLLWSIAGAGQSMVDLSIQTLIADRIPIEVQGRVYGAHFAWSHLWWAFSYPLAGWIGSRFIDSNFWLSSLIGLALLLVVQLGCKPTIAPDQSGWHEHKHLHDRLHDHNHLSALVGQSHSHLHFHAHSHH